MGLTMGGPKFMISNQIQFKFKIRLSTLSEFLSWKVRDWTLLYAKVTFIFNEKLDTVNWKIRDVTLLHVENYLFF